MEDDIVKLAWTKFRNNDNSTIINGNILAYFEEDVISFQNLTTNEEKFYQASNKTNGDGINCLCGHKIYNFFAFAEKCLLPRILVLKYSEDFEKFAIFPGNTSGQYVDICFSETELLIALVGFPVYELQIWNYRLIQLLCTVPTNIECDEQKLICNQIDPLILAQSCEILGIIKLWEIYCMAEEAIVIHRPVELSFVERNLKISFAFSLDGWIYFVDKFGNFYGMIPNGVIPKLFFSINQSEESNFTMSYYKGGYIIGNCDNGETYYIKKKPTTASALTSTALNTEWVELWKIKLTQPICKMHLITTLDKLYAISNGGSVLKLIEEKNGNVHFKQIIDQRYHVQYFDILNPETKYIIIATDEIGKLYLFDISNGNMISTFSIENKNTDNNHQFNSDDAQKEEITCLASHPLYSVIVVGHREGTLNMISYLDPKMPILCTTLCLCTSKIRDVIFSQNSGLYLASVDENNDIFIIHFVIGKQMNVVSYFSCNNSILSFSLCEILQTNDNDDEVKISILIDNGNNDQEIETLYSSNKLLIVNLKRPNFTTEMHHIQLPHEYTTVRIVSNGKGNQLKLMGSRSNSNIFDILEIKTNYNVSVLNTVETAHQLEYFTINVQWLKYIMTWGIDGLVCMFDLDTLELKATLSMGHRLQDEAITDIKCDAYRKFCLSLHSNGCLKCVETNSELLGTNAIASVKIENIFPENTIGFPSSSNQEKTWLEMKQKLDIDDEMEKFRVEKEQILENFEELKSKLQELIDENEKLEPEVRLSMANFDLNPEETAILQGQAKHKIESEKQKILKQIEESDQISKWALEQTWNQMEVKGCNLRGIFDDSIICENYGITCEEFQSNNDLKSVIFLRSIESFVSKDDLFNALVPESQNNFTESLANNLNIETETLESNDCDVINLYVPNDKFQKKSYVFSGTTTHHFIEPAKLRYKQNEIITFYQMNMETVLTENEILCLRKWFNIKFDEIKLLKQNKLTEIINQNNRTRYIHKELNILAKLLGEEERQFEEIKDPEFNFDEEPERIVKVENHEIDIKPYVSPSMEKLLQDEALKEEQRQIILKADDFRERALIKMMDGVLEKHWKDEIKKDIKPPEIILDGTNPEDEMKLLQEYNEKIEFLKSERIRYKKMIEDELIEIQLNRQKQIKDFNSKCNDLVTLKLRVDAAIKQEQIRLLRIKMFNYQRVQLLEKQNLLQIKIQEKKTKIENLLQTFEEIEKKLQELQNRYELLQSRDKSLDKQFKSQFGEIPSTATAEAAYKAFKRRPKWAQRAWETNAILLDLANRVITKNTSKNGFPLPSECYEFLQTLSNYDNYSHASTLIDQTNWKEICKMRRIKIENELKLKACGTLLAETESTLNACSKELNSKRASIAGISREITELKKQYQDHLQNRTIQIVLPLGNIKIDLTGDLSDFEGTSLLRSSYVVEINEKIKKAEEIKIKELNKLEILQRKIEEQEWELGLHKLIFNNEEEKLKKIENIKVTVELRECLKQMDQQKPQDLSSVALDREIQRRRKIYDKRIATIDEQIKITEEKLRIEKQRNLIYNNRIQRVNFQVNELSFLANPEFEAKQTEEKKHRMKMILERAALVRKIQAQHLQLLELSTILELQRLRTFPTLSSASVTDCNLHSTTKY